MALFGSKNNQNTAVLPSEVRLFNSARSGLLIAVLFTVVNTVMYMVGSDSYFLFSLFIPYSFFDPAWIAGCVIAAVVLALFVLCWVMSKKTPEIMIFSLVLLLADTAFLVYNSVLAVNEGLAGYADFIMDYVFHLWLLIEALVAVIKLKKYKETMSAIKEASSQAVSGASPSYDLAGDTAGRFEKTEEDRFSPDPSRYEYYNNDKKDQP